MKTFVVVRGASDPAQQLRKLTHELERISSPWRCPSREAKNDNTSHDHKGLHGPFSSNVCPPTIPVKLSLLWIHVTPGVLEELIYFLKHARCSIYFVRCLLAAPNSVGTLSPEEQQTLGYLLATGTVSLEFEESPRILECLLLASRLDCTQFRLQQRSRLNASQCCRLGESLKNSPKLKEFYIYSTPLDAATQFLDGLSEAVQLETLSIQEISGIANLLLGMSGGHDGAISRLVKHPHSQLKRLHLTNVDLEDCHIIEISKLLSAEESNEGHCFLCQGSRLEELNVSFNNIRTRGIVQFSQQIPRMQYLKRVALRPNPWDWASDANTWGAALLEGMQANFSIEYLDSLVGIPQAELLRHLCTLNRAGRRILPVSIPMGLWALILERAASKDSIYAMNVAGGKQLQEAKLSAIFFLLRSSQVALWRDSA